MGCCNLAFCGGLLPVGAHDLRPVIKFQIFDTFEMFRIVRHHRQPVDESAYGNKHVCVVDDQPSVFKRSLQFPECLANRIIRFDDIDVIGEISDHGKVFVNPLRFIGSIIQFADSNEGYENVINST